MHKFQINVVGLGYIGLPTAVLLANSGFYVCGTDVNQQIIESLSEGKLHFSEPQLDILFDKVIKSGHLQVSRDISPANVYLIAVPTPILNDHKPDLTFIFSAIDSILPHLKEDDLIIIESTIPPQTCFKVAEYISIKRTDLRPAKIYEDDINIFIAHCPERVLPGKIIEELVNNDRIIGGLSRKCAQKAFDVYKVAVKGECHLTDATTAELIKLTENSFRDVNIAFANELSMVCDEIGISVWDVIRFANRHPRVNILSPGPGVGGHCIAVDPWFIVDSFPNHTPLIKTAREVNDSKPHHIIKQIKKSASKMVEPTILCLGVTYKADVEDLRESPSLDIINELTKDTSYKVIISDPVLSKEQKKKLSEKFTIVDFELAIKKADIIVMLTDHSAFKLISHNDIMQKIVIDSRGVWS